MKSLKLKNDLRLNTGITDMAMGICELDLQELIMVTCGFGKETDQNAYFARLTKKDCSVLLEDH